MADDAGEISVQITANIAGLTAGLNAATAGVKESTDAMASSFTGVEGSTTEAFASMTNASERAAESMEGDFSRTEARHAAHMLGMNRAVGGFVSTLPGVGQALSMAFAPLAIMEMVEWIAKGVEKVIEFGHAAEKAAHDSGVALGENVDRYKTLTTQLLENDAALQKLAPDSEAHAEAEGRKKIIIEQLCLIYPDFIKYLIAEDGHERSIADAIKLANEARQKEVQGEIDVAKATLTALAAQEAQLRFESDNMAKMGGFGGLWAYLWDKRAGNVHESIEKQKKDLDSYLEELKKLQTLGRDTDPKAPKAPKAAKGGADAAPKDESSAYMAEFKKELEDKKDEEQNWFTWSIAAEIKFWQEKRDCAVTGSQMAIALDREIAKLKEEQGKKSEADLEKDAARNYSAAKEGSAERIELATNEFARISTIYGADTEQYKAALAKKLEATKQAEDATFAAIEKEWDREEAAAKKALDKQESDAKRTADRIARDFSSMTRGLIDGTQTWSKAFSSAMDSALNSALKMLLQTTARHIASEYLKTAATGTGTASRSMMAATAGLKDEAHSIASMVKHLFGESSKTAATATGTTARATAETTADTATTVAGDLTNAAAIASLAAVASAATFASIAAIPIVGPPAAPAAAAASYATVMAMAPLASAAGGWDNVPSDMLAQIHKQEMILPASIANPLRSVIAGGGIGGSGGDMHLHIHGGVDSKAFFQQNQGNIMATIKEAMKNRRS
jgi:2-hydroxychromene-2-carboxylate isomerase